ncbi:MAG: cytochrome b N-terminal domain-containing protein [Dehalococcoidia bacterium]
MALKSLRHPIVRAWRPLWRWFDDRTGVSQHLTPIVKHPVPPGATSGGAGWMYVLGFASMAAFALQGITGAALATQYIPSPAHAYESLQAITDGRFSGVVRGMHYYGASFMVVLVTLHLARVFLTGSYKYPREVVWLTGVGMFVLTIALAFTGQLLRWDENGVWSASVAAQYFGRVPLIGELLAEFIFAGADIGGATLSRFFALHVFFLPGLLVLLLATHLYLILRNGISEPPKAGRPVDPKRYTAWYQRLLRRHGKPYWPFAAWREAVAVSVMIGIMLTLSLTIGPRELGAPPDPTRVETNPTPDWYHLWYYALFAVYPRGWEDIVMVYAPVGVLLLMLVLPLLANKGERSPRRRPWAVGLVAMLAIVWSTLTVVGMGSPWVPEFDTRPFNAEELGGGEGPALTGAQVFHARGCQYCHQVAGRGGSYGPDLTGAVDRLSEPVVRTRTLQGMGTDMPAYADILSADEVDAIIAFLKTVPP